MAKKVRGSVSEPEELETGVDELQEDEVAETMEALDSGDYEAEEEEEEVADTSMERVSHRNMYAVEARTVASQQSLREQLAREVEEYLARGGRINVVESRAGALHGEPWSVGEEH